jgi:hypothetical protein
MAMSIGRGLFGEAACLATCGGFNIQADVAYARSADTDNSDVD